MALNLGRMDYRASLSSEDIQRFNRLMEAVEHMWDSLLHPAAPIQCTDFHFWLDEDPTQLTDITIGSPDQTSSIDITITGSPTAPTYIDIPKNVKINISVPIYLGACLILAGEQPASPTNAPTVVVGGGGSGAWASGNYFAKISYVDDSGAESVPSPETSVFAALGSPKFTIGLNNTPPAEVTHWRIYVTPANGASNSETCQEIDGDEQTVFDIPVSTTSQDLPGPYVAGPDPETAQTQPFSCFLPPCWCGKPTWTALDCEIVIDSCSTPPTIWIQRTAPSGTNWQNVIGAVNRGDLITHNGVDTILLPISTNGKVLRVTNTSDPEWDGGNYNSVTTQLLSHTPSDNFQWIGIPSAAADLTVDSTTVVLQPASVTHPVSAIRFDSDVLQAWTDNINPTQADVGIVLPDAEIILGQGTSTLAAPKSLSLDGTITNTGALTVKGWFTQPLNSTTMSAPNTGDLVYFKNAKWTALPIGTNAQVLRVTNSGVSGWDGANFNSTVEQFLEHDTSGNFKWISPTGMTNPMNSTGDMIYGSTNSTPSTPTRLPIGTTNQVLAVVGGLPTWSSLPSVGGGGANNVKQHFTGNRSTAVFPGTPDIILNNVNGLHGSIGVTCLNTGVDLAIQLVWKDMNGATWTDNRSGVAAGNIILYDPDNVTDTGVTKGSPTQRAEITFAAAVAGTTNWDVWVSMVG